MKLTGAVGSQCSLESHNPFIQVISGGLSLQTLPNGNIFLCVPITCQKMLEGAYTLSVNNSQENIYQTYSLILK